MDKTVLEPLIEFLAIPSVSMDKVYNPEMQEARRFLVNLFRSMGFKTRILKGEVHDAVFAEKIVNPKLPTVLIYGHYDVQPAEPLESWATDPFVPTIKADKLYARGATDNKGQIMVHIMTAKKLAEKGTLPVNLKFIIEGEEEVGSPSVARLVKTHKKLLDCDYLIVSDSEMLGRSRPAIDINLRGLLYTQITIEAARADMHSGQFGGVAENPANVLAHVIAQLKDEKGKVKIPGFYKNVTKPTREELADYKRVEATKLQLMKEGGFYKIGGGEGQFSLNERRWSRPTLDVNGIWGGYQGEGSKTIIPAQASAKISMRLVPNQQPAEIWKAYSLYIKKLVPKGLKVSLVRYADCLPYKAPTTHPVFELVKKALKQTFGREPLFSGVGGSIGFIPTCAKLLNVPAIMVGFGLPDENLHAPNEHFSLINYENGIKAMTLFLKSLEPRGVKKI